MDHLIRLFLMAWGFHDLRFFALKKKGLWGGFLGYFELWFIFSFILQFYYFVSKVFLQSCSVKPLNNIHI